MTGLATFGYRSPWQCKVFAMDTLIMEDFRCFAGRHEIPLAPLTLLVGENSSGKTSFLAAVRLAWDAVSRHRLDSRIDVNEAPFQLGAFEQVAHVSPSGRAAKRFILGLYATFQLGLADNLRASRARVSPALAKHGFEKEYANHDGMPQESRTIVRTGSGHDHLGYSLKVTERAGGRIELHHGSQRWISKNVETLYDLFFGGGDGRRSVKTPPTAWLDLPPEHLAAAQALASALGSGSIGANRPHAFAAVRSKPERTYDPLRADLDDEGQRAALRLAQHVALHPGGRAVADLTEFGARSGLFESIDVRLFGSIADPFQIHFQVNSVLRNIVDVGYGVSQVFPILVELLVPQPNEGRYNIVGGTNTYLIQQPEVHLHPQAQAALGSLFGSLASRDRQIIVETHSDYIIDRVRMDIRDGKGVKPEDVSLLYFEPTKVGTMIHRLRFTEDGEVCGIGENGEDTDVPPGYRAFFLKESLRLFTGLE